MEIIYAILLIVLLLLGAVYLSRFLIKKAMRDVVSVFRRRGALNPKGALTAEDLGLVKGRFTDRMFRVRDYKPDALRLLAQANVVKITEDGRLYLSEAELADSTVKRFAGIR
jgi:hypothetical protein